MGRGIVDLPGPGSGGIMGFKVKGTKEQGGEHEATLSRVRVTEPHLSKCASYPLTFI